MNVLIINCGSSSLKFQLINANTEELIAKGLCERIGIDGSRMVYSPVGREKKTIEMSLQNHTDAISQVLKLLTDKEDGVVKSLSEIDAVGHRIVHGGEKFAQSAIITDEVIKTIEDCNDLAPLHNPANLIGILACKELMKDIPMVAVFDTAFHQTMPEKAYLYGIPYELYEKYGIRRYGFHGTSHSYVAKQAAILLKKELKELKVIVCHLGNGASVSAVKHGECIDTSMGLTPLEGLIMGTRSGDLDPAILAFLAKKEKKSLDEIMDILNKESGVLGLSSNFSSDFRDLEDAYQEGNTEAIRAMDAFCYRVAKYIGGYVAAMNGVDAICFTAGVGENSPIIRSIVCEYLGYLGIELEDKPNHERGKEIIITSSNSSTAVLVIPTNEELTIARETLRLL